MRRLNLFFIFCSLLFFVTVAAHAGTYALTDGQTISGEPISFTDAGLVLKNDAGQIQPRMPWNKFTQESLKQIATEAKNPRDKAFVEPLLEEVAQEKVKRKEIIVKPVDHPERPTGRTGIFTAFSTPLGLLIFFLLYVANLYGAYEIAVYRYRPFGLVIGLSAAAPVIAPIIFLSMKPPAVPQEAPLEHTDFGMDIPTGAPVEAAIDSNPLAPPEGFHSSIQLEGGAAAEIPKPVLPDPIVFRRGEFSFNRRFFETKLAGFLRVVPGEAERDMVVYVKCARGEFVGRRVTQITPNELYLQVFKNNVTADEMIPFVEMQEVQIRHQDSF